MIQKQERAQSQVSLYSSRRVRSQGWDGDGTSSPPALIRSVAGGHLHRRPAELLARAGGHPALFGLPALHAGAQSFGSYFQGLHTQNPVFLTDSSPFSWGTWHLERQSGVRGAAALFMHFPG